MISLVIDSIEDDELIVLEEFEEWDPVPDVTAVASRGQPEDACPVGGGGVRFDGQVKGDFVLRAPVFQWRQRLIAGDGLCGKAFLEVPWPNWSSAGSKSHTKIVIKQITK